MKIQYKIGIVGLGSIGRRHFQNIMRVLNKKNIEYTIDLFRRRESKPIEEQIKNDISNIYYDYNDAPDDYDIVFVTNPTHLHYETINSFAFKTKHMFIEKPIFDDVYEVPEKIKRLDGVFYVACPLRYSRPIHYIKNNIDISTIYSIRVIASSYLPDWRPKQDYKSSYSAKTSQGGGVSLDLIHEWDYILYLFGIPKKVNKFSGKYSHLDINSEDLAVYVADYENMFLELHLDYFGRTPLRQVQLFMKNDTLVVDLINNKIEYTRLNNVIEFDEERNDMYLSELENFFDVIENNAPNTNDIKTALQTLQIAKGEY